VLSVKLKTDKKEYIGNLNNIRQLYFNKTLAVSLKLNHFSLQDRQIIRFLAINSEPESSKLLLNSEQTAEFFHCLVGFDRFFREGRRLIVHAESAEPVVLKKYVKGKLLLSPGAKIGEALLPVKAAKVITGRSGCWLGTCGEYWWIPATVDVSWMRNFFRCSEQELGAKGVEKIQYEGTFPVPVMDGGASEVRTKKCSVSLNGSFDDEENFVLKVSFLYDNVVFPANEGRLASGSGRFWSREEEAEKELLDDLHKFGFVKTGHLFKIADSEAAGVFLDKVLAQWCRTRENLSLDASLARMARGGCGLPEAEIRCSIAKQLKEKFLISYDLKAAGHTISWNRLIKALKSGQKYYKAAPDCIIKIDRNMRDFLLAANGTVQKIDDKSSTFELLHCSVHYWKHIGRLVPGAIPTEFLGGGGFDPEGIQELNQSIVEEELQERFKGDLRHYQVEGVNWMRQLTDNGFNVILADEMGLGKTVQTLALLASRKGGDAGPVMIICPASLTENWKRESEKFVPAFNAVALAGTGRDEVWENAYDYDLIIVSYATARRDTEKFKSIKFSYVILDEAQHIKNPGTVNAQSCKKIKADHRMVLTGTPLENSSEDLWSIFDFLHPGMLGSFNSFKSSYSGIREDKTLQEDLAAKVAPFIKRRTKDVVCSELPPKQEQTLFCEMPPAQRKLYNEMLENGRQQLALLGAGKNGKTNFEILTILLRLRQICCDPALLPGDIGAKVESAKLELLKELVLQNIDSGHKMLLFSQFTSLLGIIKEWLKEEKITFEYLDGATRNRQQRVDNFNNTPEIPVFLLSLKAGGTGLNLTSADTVIIYDPWWNPAVELQAADRTHRIGQTRPVSSLKLVVKDSIEEKILALQSQKQEIFDNIIENPASYADKLSIEELKFLFK
jgi:superfamily II DNA or RNA helicase